MLIEGLKVVGLVWALLLAFGLLYALAAGLWQAITGQGRKQQEAVSKAWTDGWNAAMRGADADQAEWIRRMDDGLGR